MLVSRLALAAAAVVAVSGAASAAQPVDLYAPAPLIPAESPVAQAPVAAPTQALPAMRVSSFGAAVPYLDTAQTAIDSRRYNAARTALEQAETRLLNDGAGPKGTDTVMSTGGQALAQVRLARDAVIRHDRQSARIAISLAIAAAESPLAGSEAPTALVSVAPSSVALTAPPAPPPAPMITKALLPGHWQMGAWQYHWVPPATQLRTVENHAWIQGHYVWRNRAWVWVGSHYGDE